MANNILEVQMFGEFSIRYGDRVIRDSEKQSRRTWLSLAYLIYHRNRVVSKEELSELLWGDYTEINNPAGALRNILYQVRTVLRQLDEEVFGGDNAKDLILRRSGGYKWNTDIPMHVDVEEFERFYRAAAAAQSGEDHLLYGLKAAELYQNDFLQKMSSELWVRPIAVSYHDQYINLALSVMEELEAQERMAEAVQLGNKALTIDAYNEEIYMLTMRNLLEMGEFEEVISLYERMQKLFVANFGIMPEEETRAIYYEAVKKSNNKSMPFEALQEQLNYLNQDNGALVCELDFFKYIYNYNVRQLERSGITAHISMFSVGGRMGAELSERSRDIAMDNLLALMGRTLRRGDVISRCSVNQIVVLLPMSNYENSCMVSQRLERAFFRQYPHSPIQLEYVVSPLGANKETTK